MLQPEQVLQGRYQLKRKLGHNAGRQTWLAVDLGGETGGTNRRGAEGAEFQPRVIVKFLALSDEVGWDALKLVEREGCVLRQLQHPRIPEYLDSFCVREQGIWFGLVQEYVPGCSLQELLDEGKRFTESQVRQVAAEVLELLVYLHELNPPVLHRDIKPGNLIWGEDGHVYLVDFGAVQNQAATEGASFTVVGTYGYAPIEQFGGRAVPASDLYALGATLIHLITGTVPADLPQQNLQIQFADRVSISSNLVCWLTRMSDPVLERRFGTARLALLELTAPLSLSPSMLVNNSGQGGLFDSSVSVPEEIKGWNWGAFLLAPFWLLSNRVWIGSLVWVPLVGFWAAIALGIKGNEWAWKSRRWQSIEQFQAHQKRWAMAGIIYGISVNLIVWNVGILLLISLAVH